MSLKILGGGYKFTEFACFFLLFYVFYGYVMSFGKYYVLIVLLFDASDGFFTSVISFHVVL